MCGYLAIRSNNLHNQQLVWFNLVDCKCPEDRDHIFLHLSPSKTQFCAVSQLDFVLVVSLPGLLTPASLNTE